jgi:hypothetical protein
MISSEWKWWQVPGAMLTLLHMELQSGHNLQVMRTTSARILTHLKPWFTLELDCIETKGNPRFQRLRIQTQKSHILFLNYL